MKNYKIVIYIVSIIVVLCLGFAIFKNVSQANEEDPKEKVDSEVRYLETTLVGLLNDMNNIDSRNYNLSINEIPQESQKTAQGSGSSSSSSGEGSGSGGESGSGSGAESQQENAGGTILAKEAQVVMLQLQAVILAKPINRSSLMPAVYLLVLKT